jgi:hypothetical protein
MNLGKICIDAGFSVYYFFLSDLFLVEFDGLNESSIRYFWLYYEALIDPGFLHKLFEMFHELRNGHFFCYCFFVGFTPNLN